MPGTPIDHGTGRFAPFSLASGAEEPSVQSHMILPDHGRYPYSAIHKRPTYEWPNGARLAVTFYDNIEAFAFRAGLGSDSTGATAPQSQRNFAWRDYGNRVGLWAYLDLLDEYGLPGSHNVNAYALELYPDIVERLNARGDEYVGHGRTNAERQDVLWERDEARLIGESTETIVRLSGRRPEGWMGPYFAQSTCTLDLLKEAGYAYVLDWPADDQPFWMRTRAGPILSVPYPVEVNDSPAMVFRQHTGRDFEAMMIDQFDEMLHRAERWPLVCGFVAHPFIVGQPFRLRAFRRAVEHVLAQRERVWITTPGAIARHCAGLPESVLPKP